jgi:predicted NBD/HSP70 family sugar kinase
MNKTDKNNFVISGDIGGTHITAAVIDLGKKMIIEDTRTRVNVNSQGTATEILKSWSAALTQAYGKFGSPVQQVALAMPGPFDYEKGISLIKDLHKYGWVDSGYYKRASVIIVKDDKVIHQKYFGNYTPETVAYFIKKEE